MSWQVRLHLASASRSRGWERQVNSATSRINSAGKDLNDAIAVQSLCELVCKPREMGVEVENAPENSIKRRDDGGAPEHDHPPPPLRHSFPLRRPTLVSH